MDMDARVSSDIGNELQRARWLIQKCMTRRDEFDERPSIKAAFRLVETQPELLDELARMEELLRSFYCVAVVSDSWSQRRRVAEQVAAGEKTLEDAAAELIKAEADRLGIAGVA